MEQDQNSSSLFQLSVDGPGSYILRSAASWAKVLAITGFIISILFIILGVVMQAMLSKAPTGRYYGEDLGSSSKMVGAMGTMGLILYVFIGILYGISSLFAYNFASKISGAVKTNDQVMLNAGFSSARNFFAFWAILTILAVLMVLISVAGIASMPSSYR